MVVSTLENFEVSLHAKNALHHLLVSWDIHFKESCSLIGQQHFHLSFKKQICQICDWCWNINNNTSFHFILFPEELITKFFKTYKKPYFGVNWSSFSPNLGENQFSWKKRLCQFLNIPIIYHGAKYLKILTNNSW